MMIQKQMWTDNPSEWTEDELLFMKYKGICYGKGGSPPSAPPAPAVQTTVNQSEFPTELQPFIEDIFGKAQAIQEQRTEEGFPAFPGALQAEFDPAQTRAFEAIEEIPGRTAPFFDRATEFAETAALAPTDPAEQAAFMNPFLRNVVDIEKREAERIADVQKQQADAQAVQAGAFGGSRPAIIEAERQRNLNQQLGDIEARGLAAAFQDAQSRIAQQRQREAGAATQLASLGAAIPAQQLKELGALSGVGAARQTQGQRGIDLARQEFEAEEAFPLQTLQEFQSILRGFPIAPTRTTSTQQFSAAQPLSTQLLGVGTQALGALGSAGFKPFGQAGGMVGNLPRKRTALESLVSQTEGLDTKPVVAMARGGSFVEQLLTSGLLGTDKAQNLLGKVGNPGLQALTGFMGPKFIKAARGLFGKGPLGEGAATPTPAASAATQLTAQKRKELLEQELRRIAAQGQQTAARGTGLGQVGTQLAGVRQNVGAKGGGGLRQMVKLPLPSNRVQFGKTAYQDASYVGEAIEDYVVTPVTEFFTQPFDIGNARDRAEFMRKETDIFKERYGSPFNLDIYTDYFKPGEASEFLKKANKRKKEFEKSLDEKKKSKDQKDENEAARAADKDLTDRPSVKKDKGPKLYRDPEEAAYASLIDSEAGQKAAERYFKGENVTLATVSEALKAYKGFKDTEMEQRRLIDKANKEKAKATAAARRARLGDQLTMAKISKFLSDDDAAALAALTKSLETVYDEEQRARIQEQIETLTRKALTDPIARVVGKDVPKYGASPETIRQVAIENEVARQIAAAQKAKGT
jgi:hypothetical protein